MRLYKNRMFFKWAKSAGLTDAMLRDAANEIDAGLIEANLGRGLFKKRIARNGQGKRGGFRTIALFQKGHRTFFLYGFAKNQRDNLSKQDEAALKKLARNLLDTPDSKLKDMIINGDLYEVTHE